MQEIPESIKQWAESDRDAWDPDYTKVTPQEAAQLAEAEEAFARGECVSHDEIDWD